MRKFAVDALIYAALPVICAGLLLIWLALQIAPPGWDPGAWWESSR